MANAKRCDRCGGFYIPRVDGVEMNQISIYSSKSRLSFYWDLCEKCMEELVRFINNGTDDNKNLIDSLKRGWEEQSLQMKFVIRYFDNYLTIQDKRELLAFSGDDKRLEVLETGEIVEKTKCKEE